MKVAARRVFFLWAPDVVAQHPAGRVDRVFHAGKFALAGALVAGNLLGGGAVHVGTEGGDLNDFVLAATAVDHVHDAETPADDEGAAEQALDLLGRGVGGHIKVFRAQANQQVAHRAAHDVSLKARLLQRADDVQGALVHQLEVNAVHCSGDFLALAERVLLDAGGGGGAGGLAKQLVDEFFDHGKHVRATRRAAARQTMGLGLN